MAMPMNMPTHGKNPVGDHVLHYESMAMGTAQVDACFTLQSKTEAKFRILFIPKNHWRGRLNV